MEIELKNGRKILLDLNPIVMEYFADYVGGIEQMQKDIKNSNNLIYVANHIAYSMINGNIKEKLTFEETMSLLKIEDVERIIDFINAQSLSVFDKTNQANELKPTIKRHW